MAIQSATPYLILNGRAPRAIALYERALGADVTTVQRFGDVDGSCPDAQRNQIMHAEVRLGGATVMLSDGPGDGSPSGGGSVSVALALNDSAETRRYFDGLAASGAVIEPLFDAPWGALFGVVRDEFGIHWMFNCATK
jgi:PhnB protein